MSHVTAQDLNVSFLRTYRAFLSLFVGGAGPGVGTTLKMTLKIAWIAANSAAYVIDMTVNTLSFLSKVTRCEQCICIVTNLSNDVMVSM